MEIKLCLSANSITIIIYGNLFPQGLHSIESLEQSIACDRWMFYLDHVCIVNIYCFMMYMLNNGPGNLRSLGFLDQFLVVVCWIHWSSKIKCWNRRICNMCVRHRKHESRHFMNNYFSRNIEKQALRYLQNYLSIDVPVTQVNALMDHKWRYL